MGQGEGREKEGKSVTQQLHQWRDHLVGSVVVALASVHLKVPMPQLRHYAVKRPTVNAVVVIWTAQPVLIRMLVVLVAAAAPVKMMEGDRKVHARETSG